MTASPPDARAATVLTLFAFLALSCGPATKEQVKKPPAKTEPPTLEELLPLKDRTVSSFETTSDLGDQGLLILEIFRPRRELAELKIAGRTQRLLVEPGRISHATGGVLLQEPLKVGQKFRGSFGTTEIIDINKSVQLRAGKFDQCLVTVEESTRPPKRSTSTYCRDVGLSHLVVEVFGAEGAGRLETSLTEHAPRVDVRDEKTLATPKEDER